MRSNQSLICLEARQPLLSRLKVYALNPHVWLVHRYRKYQMTRARKLGLAIPDCLIAVGYAGEGNKTNPKNWLRVLEHLPCGTYEILCHPAYPDETLRRWSFYSEERAQELAILCQLELRNKARELGVEIISFHDI
jgi:predicted glycoside hydrolase/deacetylase ChbG (UPF0249 family)